MAQKFGSGINLKSILSEKSLQTLEQMGMERLEVVKLPTESIDPFPDHPYQVKDDEAMTELVESIKTNGVITPVTVRKMDNGRYQLISGHRRKHACELAGIAEIPAAIIVCTDEEATVRMVDANLQRPKILPSEKAFAYKMKLEALKKKAGRPNQENYVPMEHNFDGRTSREILAEDTGESETQISRYIRLTYLIPEFLQKVDDEILSFRTAVEISYLSEEEQRDLLSLKMIPYLDQATKLKKYSKIRPLQRHEIKAVIEGRDPFYKEEKKEAPQDRGEAQTIIQKLLSAYGTDKAPVEDNETSDVTTSDAVTNDAVTNDASANDASANDAPIQDTVQLEDVAIIPPEVDTDEPKTEEINTDIRKSVAPVEAYANYIDNWTGEENAVMKGYVLYALKLIKTYSPKNELTDKQKDALMQMLSWATDDLMAQEAYEYYLNN